MTTKKKPTNPHLALTRAINNLVRAEIALSDSGMQPPADWPFYKEEVKAARQRVQKAIEAFAQAHVEQGRHAARPRDLRSAIQSMIPATPASDRDVQRTIASIVLAAGSPVEVHPGHLYRADAVELRRQESPETGVIVWSTHEVRR
jgi:hypothetical protein